jgi:hypothetical protein
MVEHSGEHSVTVELWEVVNGLNIAESAVVM